MAFCWCSSFLWQNPLRSQEGWPNAAHLWKSCCLEQPRLFARSLCSTLNEPWSRRAPAAPASLFLQWVLSLLLIQLLKSTQTAEAQLKGWVDRGSQQEPLQSGKGKWGILERTCIYRLVHVKGMHEKDQRQQTSHHFCICVTFFCKSLAYRHTGQVHFPLLSV